MVRQVVIGRADVERLEELETTRIASRDGEVERDGWARYQGTDHGHRGIKLGPGRRCRLRFDQYHNSRVLHCIPSGKGFY